MMDNLSYNAKNRGAITDLVDDILNYYGLESSKVLVKVLYEKIDEVCGTYSSNCETYGEIMIRIDPEISTYDSIVATAFHECAHYYMAIRKIRLQDVQENERLTDLTALYLGGDGYYKRNYDIKRFSNLQPGYLTYDELHYAIERICELRKEKEKKIHQLNLTNKASFEDAKSLSDKVIALEKQLCFDNVICEPETIQKVFHIYADLKEKSDSYFSVCSKTLYNSLPTISEINRIEAQKKEQKNKVESLYKELKKYVELIEEQKVYSPTVYDYLKNISRLAGEGNVFCLFEKLKFYCLSSKTMDDAKIIYEKIKHHGTADSLFVLGKCFDEGVYVAQDKEHARELFLLAAKDGSVDAQKKITMIEAF